MGILDIFKEHPVGDRTLIGPPKPRPPTPGLHLPLGCHIPDWRQYKVDSYTPELLEVQKKLAARGLKDPWIRNEVWRYDTRIWGTKRWVNWKLLTFGMGYGIAFFLITIALESTVFKKKDEHKH